MNTKTTQVEITKPMIDRSGSMAAYFDFGSEVDHYVYGEECPVAQCYKTLGLVAKVDRTATTITLPDGEKITVDNTESMSQTVKDFDKRCFDTRKLIGRVVDLAVPGDLK